MHGKNNNGSLFLFVQPHTVVINDNDCCTIVEEYVIAIQSSHCCSYKIMQFQDVVINSSDHKARFKHPRGYDDRVIDHFNIKTTFQYK